MKQLLLELWVAIEPAHEFIFALGLSVVSAATLWLFRAKVNLVWGSTSTNYHNFKLSEEGEPISIWTEKFYIQNVGRKAASSIEIVFNDLPTSYNLWSPRAHDAYKVGEKYFAIKIPSLAPQELLIVDMIDIERKQVRLLSVNCPDAVTKSVEFEPSRKFGFAVNALIAFLLVAGIIGTFYAVLQMILR